MSIYTYMLKAQIISDLALPHSSQVDHNLYIVNEVSKRTVEPRGHTDINGKTH